MDLTAFIDVAIGLSLIYLGTSLYVTIVNEFIAQKLQLRGKQLAKDLLTLIDDDGLKDKLRKVPALKCYLDDKGKAGSFIDTNVLGRFLVGAVGDHAGAAASMADIIKSIDELPDSNIKTQLTALARSTTEDIDRFVANVSQWADSSLSVLGEVYKKNMQKISFAIGLLVAVLLNLDTLTIVDHLYHNKEARNALVVVAETFTESTQKETLNACLKLDRAARADNPDCQAITGLVEAIQGGNATLGVLPIGWKGWAEVCDLVRPANFTNLFTHIIGWLITALAVALGAPFWFDLLNRLVNVRHGMRRPDPTQNRT